MQTLFFYLIDAEFTNASLTCPYLLDVESGADGLKKAYFEGNSNVYSSINTANFETAKILAFGVPGKPSPFQDHFNKKLEVSESVEVEWNFAKLLKGTFNGGNLSRVKMDGKISTNPRIGKYSTAILKDATISNTSIKKALLSRVKIENISDGINLCKNVEVTDECLILT